MPKPSAKEVLVKLIASGGAIDHAKIHALTYLGIDRSAVCRSDLSLLRVDKQASWFRETYILVRPRVRVRMTDVILISYHHI